MSNPMIAVRVVDADSLGHVHGGDEEGSYEPAPVYDAPVDNSTSTVDTSQAYDYPVEPQQVASYPEQPVSPDPYVAQAYAPQPFSEQPAYNAYGNPSLGAGYNPYGAGTTEPQQYNTYGNDPASFNNYGTFNEPAAFNNPGTSYGDPYTSQPLDTTNLTPPAGLSRIGDDGRNLASFNQDTTTSPVTGLPPNPSGLSEFDEARATAAIDSMVARPEYPTQAPHIDTSGVPDTGNSYAQEVLHRASLRDFADTATPQGLTQGNLGTCFTIATLNEVNSTPAGREHLQSNYQDLGDGWSRVTLTNRDGTPNQVTVLDHPGLGSTGDPMLRAYEQAIAVNRLAPHEGVTAADNYDGVRNGAWPSSVMQDLGMRSAIGSGAPREYAPNNAIMTYESRGGEMNGNFMVMNTQAPGTNPLAAESLREYGLVGPHAYQVQSTYIDPTTSEPMMVLQNPHGMNHGSPIPQSAMGSLFSSYSFGHLPRM